MVKIIKLNEWVPKLIVSKINWTMYNHEPSYDELKWILNRQKIGKELMCLKIV